MSHKLTPKQLRAVYLLAQGASINQVANELRMRRETLSRWKRIQEFHEKLESVAGESRRDMRYRLMQMVESSIDTAICNIGRYNGDPKRLQVALNVLKLLKIDQILTENPIKAPEIQRKRVEVIANNSKVDA